jgi:hypothetical protein
MIKLVRLKEKLIVALFYKFAWNFNMHLYKVYQPYFDLDNTGCKNIELNGLLHLLS